MALGMSMLVMDTIVCICHFLDDLFMVVPGLLAYLHDTYDYTYCECVGTLKFVLLWAFNQQIYI